MLPRSSKRSNGQKRPGQKDGSRFQRENSNVSISSRMPTKAALQQRGDRHPHWPAASLPIADAWLTEKGTRVAALAPRTRASLLALAARTRASLAAHADWKRTPPLKREGGGRERFVLTLRSTEGCQRLRA